MAGSGPPPNPNSRKQVGSQAHTWTDLPAGGFDGDIPEWPLPGGTDRELEVWAAIWRTPQAFAWHLNGWLHDVAMYVRYLVLGEAGELKAATESRMWSDRLGLNPAAMLKNRWRVRPDEVAEKRTERTASKTKARRRLKVADDAVAGS